LVKDDRRPVLACVNFIAKEGKLQLVSADGFRLAVVALDYEGEGQALINYQDLQGMVNALRRAKRARISFAPKGKLEVQDLVLDTDLIHYKWTSVQGSFPEWQQLIPTDGKTVVHFDTIEAVKAIGALKALADSKMYAVDLAIGEGKVTMTDTDNKGQAEVNADIEGEPVTVRLNGNYLMQALKACGGMVDLSIGSATAPMLFTTNGYRVVQMPMATSDAKVAAPKPSEPKADVVAEAEAVAAKAEATSKPAAKRPKQKQKAKQLTAVA
jgi:DNA polymerase III sliding clamp (beta) subunit (PCNA family)